MRLRMDGRIKWVRNFLTRAEDVGGLARRPAGLMAVLLLILLAVAGCGPTEEEQQATGTAVAAAELATRTAEAPTATTIPTATPMPTNTPAPTATPAPDYAVIAITEDDLPGAFVARPENEMTFRPGEAAPFPVPSEVVAGYEFELPGEAFVVGFSVRILDETEGPRFDATLDYMNQLFLASSPAEEPTPLEDLADLEDIGEAVSGQTTTITDAAGVQYQIDVLTFRRADIATFLVLGFAVENEPDVAVSDLARLVDQRIRDGLDTSNGR